MDCLYTYIGMDLGSYKTSVACSNGRREVIQSAVGWPKDQIARAMLGEDVVFGKAIRERRLALDIIRPFEKGMLKYNACSEYGVGEERLERHREAARLLVAHAVQLTRPEAGRPICGVIGAPSRASILNKQVLLEAAGDTFDVVAIVPEPFTVAYGMNRLVDALVIDIGAGTIDICPLHGTFPTEESQVTVAIGGDVVDDKLRELIENTYPEVRLSENMVRDIKERHGFVDDPKERVVLALPTAVEPQEFDLTELVREACQALLPPIVEGVREVVNKYDPEFQQTLIQNVILGGGGSQLSGLDRQIEKALQGYGAAKVVKAYDSVFAGAVGALKLAMEMPAEYWEQIRLVASSPAEAA